MIIVPVKEGENIERALKKFKRKYEKTGVVKELRRRQQFDKPSELKRLQMEHAIYVQKLQQSLVFSFIYSSLNPFRDEFCYVYRPVRGLSQVGA